MSAGHDGPRLSQVRADKTATSAMVAGLLTVLGLAAYALWKSVS
jgi:hypothetical protein